MSKTPTASTMVDGMEWVSEQGCQFTSPASTVFENFEYIRIG